MPYELQSPIDITDYEPTDGPAPQFAYPGGDPVSALDAALLMPASSAHCRYRGSLTTPPFDGPVEWIVMRERGAVSQEIRDPAFAEMTGMRVGSRLRGRDGFSSRSYQTRPCYTPAGAGIRRASGGRLRRRRRIREGESA